MDRKSDNAVRLTPDPTRSDEQFQLSPPLLTNIKKEPVDDYIDELIPLQNSLSVCNNNNGIRIKTEKPESSSPLLNPEFEVTRGNAPLQSGCSTMICNSGIRIKTEDPEISRSSRTECEVPLDNDPLQSGCSTVTCNSGIRIKTENPESRPRSKPVCQVTPENRPLKRTAEESNPFLIEKLELIKKRAKLESPEPSSPSVVDDARNDCGKQKDPKAKRVFKLIPLSQLRNSTAKDNMKPVPFSEIRKIISIPLGKQQCNVSEAKSLKLSSEAVFSSSSNTSKPAIPAYKSDEFDGSSSESESEAETFLIDTIEVFNACSIIDENDIDQGIEYMSTVPLNSSFELLYERNKISKVRFRKKQQHKVSEDSVRTTSEKSTYFGLGARVVKNPATEPIGDRDGLLDISSKASGATSWSLQPAVTYVLMPECEGTQTCISMPSVLQTVNRTVSKLTSKVLEKAVVFPSCKLPPSSNSESSLLKQHSSGNGAAKAMAEFAPQITRIEPVFASPNKKSKTSDPTINYHADESTPSIPQLTAEQLQNILSMVKAPQSREAADLIPSTSVIAETADILNYHRGSYNSPAILGSSSSKGPRSPVVNRFLDTKNVDFN